MTKTLHGKVHGKTIELDEDLGVAEGQEVEVQIIQQERNDVRPYHVRCQNPWRPARLCPQSRPHMQAGGFAHKVFLGYARSDTDAQMARNVDSQRKRRTFLKRKKF
jgi:hypothetical protein